jgi:large subunit ribosomal protein L18e
MISNTKLKNRIRRKTNPELAETIKLAMKNEAWRDIAKILSGPTKKLSSVSLSKIESESKAGDTVVIPGKVLSQGELKKKLRICALSISENALEKLKESKSDFATIIEEIKKNQKAQGVKLIR